MKPESPNIKRTTCALPFGVVVGDGRAKPGGRIVVTNGDVPTGTHDLSAGRYQLASTKAATSRVPGAFVVRQERKDDKSAASRSGSLLADGDPAR